MNINDIQYIASLIAQHRIQEISSEQQAQLKEWLKENESNQHFFESLNRKSISTLGETTVHKRTHFPAKEGFEIFSQNLKINSTNHFLHLRIINSLIASFILFIGISFYLIYQSSEFNRSTNFILPGNSIATLELADGSIVNLNDTLVTNKTIESTILFDKGQIQYQASQKIDIKDNLQFHTLTIPRGGEFKVVLNDGTEVWLNANSKLRYPNYFLSNQREVYLEGEAYFKVQSNPNKPFIIYSGIQKITVLGTSLGITNYTEDSTQSITLVNGRVAVEFINTHAHSYILKPGEQLLYHKMKHTVTCQSVNCDEFVSWKDGRYLFRDETLENILNTLARWYDFTFFFQNSKIKSVRFTGELKRFDDFDDILYLIEKSSDIHFTIQNRNVIVHQ